MSQPVSLDSVCPGVVTAHSDRGGGLIKTPRSVAPYQALYGRAPAGVSAGLNARSQLSVFLSCHVRCSGHRRRTADVAWV